MLSRKSPLSEAVFVGDLVAVQRLLFDGADPNCFPIDRDPPLHSAIEGENLNIVEELLQAGADPNLRGPGNWTPLARAIDCAGDVVVQNFPQNVSRTRRHCLHPFHARC